MMGSLTEAISKATHTANKAAELAEGLRVRICTLEAIDNSKDTEVDDWWGDIKPSDGLVYTPGTLEVSDALPALDPIAYNAAMLFDLLKASDCCDERATAIVEAWLKTQGGK